ncbi:MAG: hypothetical protein NTX64_01950 [Elusimicrobia bacterium]|nr:hypothetical protein [Elusimicrobiota bacterium]
MRPIPLIPSRLVLMVQPAFWFTLVFLAYGKGPFSDSWVLRIAILVVWVLIFAVSVLCHELGHACAVLAFGERATIRLHAFGGQTEPQHAMDRLPLWKQILVVAAGPLAGLLLAAAAAGTFFGFVRLGVTGIWLRFVLDFAHINVIWSVVNLLPILPMDGGRLLAVVLGKHFGPRGLRFVHGIGATLSGAGLCFSLVVHNQFNAIFFALMGAGSLNAMKQIGRRTAQDEDPATQKEFAGAQERLRDGATGEAVRRLIALRKKTKRGRIFEACSETLGLVFLATQRPAAAYAMLTSLEQEQLTHESRVALQGLCCRRGDYEKALAIGRAIFPQRLDPLVAYFNARACAGLKKDDGALQWLRSAIRQGLRDPKALAEPEFDRLRGREDFAELKKSLGGG